MNRRLSCRDATFVVASRFPAGLSGLAAASDATMALDSID
jgi:hypothetical protein